MTDVGGFRRSQSFLREFTSQGGRTSGGVLIWFPECMLGEGGLSSAGTQRGVTFRKGTPESVMHDGTLNPLRAQETAALHASSDGVSEVRTKILLLRDSASLCSDSLLMMRGRVSL